MLKWKIVGGKKIEVTAEESEEYEESIREAEVPDVPSDADKFEAQLMYTALMTDTLLEDEE